MAILAYPARLELATFGVGGQHSIQLSYGYIICIIWHRRHSCSVCFANLSLNNCASGTRLHVFRCASLALASSKATFACRQKNAVLGIFLSSSSIQLSYGYIICIKSSILLKIQYIANFFRFFI